jgi:hypothetical protein
MEKGVSPDNMEELDPEEVLSYLMEYFRNEAKLPEEEIAEFRAKLTAATTREIVMNL